MTFLNLPLSKSISTRGFSPLTQLPPHAECFNFDQLRVTWCSRCDSDYTLIIKQINYCKSRVNRTRLPPVKHLQYGQFKSRHFNLNLYSENGDVCWLFKMFKIRFNYKIVSIFIVKGQQKILTKYCAPLIIFMKEYNNIIFISIKQFQSDHWYTLCSTN
jgi:hypothetical protein